MRFGGPLTSGIAGRNCIQAEELSLGISKTDALTQNNREHVIPWYGP